MKKEVDRFCIVLSMLVGLTLYSSCGFDKPAKTEDAEAAAEGYATAFFNFDYTRAMSYCDSTSNEWLRMFVSNLTQADIDSIQSLTQRPSIALEKVKRENNDSLAIAWVTIKDAYVLDTIGKPGHLTDHATLRLHMVLSPEGRWLIRRADLLQNEK